MKIDDVELKFVPRSKRVQPSPSSAAPSKKRPLSNSPVVLPAWRVDREKPAEARPPPLPLKWNEKPRLDMTERDWRIMRTDLEITASRISVSKAGQTRERLQIEPLLQWQELHDAKMRNFLLKKFPTPTPVQRCAVQLALQRTNIVIKAPTGSGKTLGFLVPLAELRPQKALILAPTRELAVQIGAVASQLVANVALLVGGHNLDDQAEQLVKNPKVIIATPGRLLDFLGSHEVDIADCDYLVFDEADRMIDLGFEPQISQIRTAMTGPKQTLMFSATWPASMAALSEQFLKPEYYMVEIGRIPAENVKQVTVEIAEKDKLVKLLQVLAQHRSAIVFVNTKARADHLNAELCNHKIKSVVLHGSLSQESRIAAIDALRTRKAKCLVATDVAARGVDVPGMSLVVNYDMPRDKETFVHRIGRTGRAGEHGTAISFSSNEPK